MFAATAHRLSDDGFDRIVAGLYDAATGGRAWAAALDPIQEVFGARAVVAAHHRPGGRPAAVAGGRRPAHGGRGLRLRRELGAARPAQAGRAAAWCGGHQLLESFAYPMWLLALDREVQFANTAALSMEVKGQPVRCLQGRLRLSGPADDRRLSVLMHELAQCAHHTRRPLRLGGAEGNDAAWLHLSVLEPAQVMGLAFGAERCIVATLFSPTQVSALDPFALAQMFELTPAEARVATLLGEGVEPVAIAERLNVRVTTVRTHLRQVLWTLAPGPARPPGSVSPR